MSPTAATLIAPPSLPSRRLASTVLAIVALMSLAGGIAVLALGGPGPVPGAVVATAMAEGDHAPVATATRNPHRLPRNAQRHVGTAAPRGLGLAAAVA
jgi:hypothetical protein